MPSKRIKSFLNKIKEKYGKIPLDLHITRKACALIAISDQKVILMEEPEVKYCPLFKALFSYKDINKKSIENKFLRQVKECGMFTSERIIEDGKIIVPFGASEMIMYALKRKIVESAVIVCEGAGTIITSKPEVVQGIGAYMNGLFYTSPISEVISRLKKSGSDILNQGNAEINQFKGLLRSIKSGCKNIAVTVRGDERSIISKIRKLEEDYDINITILVICNTGIDKKQAETVGLYGDIVWACASKHIREVVGPASILQVGMKIPVFVLTGRGIFFISGYSSGNILKNIKDLDKKHYITSNKYEKGGLKINMGKFSVYLYETEKLPVSTFDEPKPLI